MRLVVAMSGASGAIYGIRLLEALRTTRDIETHLVLSEHAKLTISLETSVGLEYVTSLAFRVYDNTALGAAPASGSFRTGGMVVVPCSVKTLSAIANSYASTLVVRAADVTLKERRRLVLVVRETPLHLGHLRQMVAAAEMGAVILPPCPAFYHRPSTIDELVNHTVARVLDQLGIEHALGREWEGMGTRFKEA
jgi:flavin prenyltransferase